MPVREGMRRHLFYSGRVQGVGFRFTAQRIASGFAVTGWVRNLPDDRVEMLVEGEKDETARRDRHHAPATSFSFSNRRTR